MTMTENETDSQPQERVRTDVDGTDVTVAAFDDGIIAITHHGSVMTVTVPVERIESLKAAIEAAEGAYTDDERADYAEQFG